MERNLYAWRIVKLKARFVPGNFPKQFRFELDAQMQWAQPECHKWLEYGFFVTRNHATNFPRATNNGIRQQRRYQDGEIACPLGVCELLIDGCMA